MESCELERQVHEVKRVSRAGRAVARGLAAQPRPKGPEVLYSAEGVTATRLTDAFRICLAHPGGPPRPFDVAWALWQMWIVVRDQRSLQKMDWVVDAAALDDLPLPLICMLSVLSRELANVGRQLSVVPPERYPSKERRENFAFRIVPPGNALCAG